MRGQLDRLCTIQGNPEQQCEFFFFQAEDGIRDLTVTGVQTCALPIWSPPAVPSVWSHASGRQFAVVPTVVRCTPEKFTCCMMSPTANCNASYSGTPLDRKSVV